MTVTKFTSKSANFVKSLFLIYQIVPSVLACVCVFVRACVLACERGSCVCVCVCDSGTKPNTFSMEIFFSLKLLSVHSYGQSFIMTVQRP